VEDWNDQVQVGVLSGQTIGRLVMSCAIRIVHMEETRTTGFFGLASKPVAMVCQWFGLKTTAKVSWFGPQNQGRWFGDLGLKITTMVSLFGPQNQLG
jgi:hypothetical protein